MLEWLQDNLSGIQTLCRVNHVRSLEVFGSVTTERFNDSSDVDFVVSFFDLPAGMRAEAYFNLWFSLEDLLGRRVDLIVKDAIHNPYFAREVTRTSQPLFEAETQVTRGG